MYSRAWQLVSSKLCFSQQKLIENIPSFRDTGDLNEEVITYRSRRQTDCQCCHICMTLCMGHVRRAVLTMPEIVLTLISKYRCNSRLLSMTYTKRPRIFLFRIMLKTVVCMFREKLSRHESGIHQSVEGKKKRCQANVRFA